MKIKANIFNLQCWIYMETTYELSKAALFLWWIVRIGIDFSRASGDKNSFTIKQQCFFKTLKILARKQEKGYFSRTSWFRNATASFCVPIELSCEGSSQTSCWTGFTTAKHTALPHTYSYGVLQ